MKTGPAQSKKPVKTFQAVDTYMQENQTDSPSKELNILIICNHVYSQKVLKPIIKNTEIFIKTPPDQKRADDSMRTPHPLVIP